MASATCVTSLSTESNPVTHNVELTKRFDSEPNEIPEITDQNYKLVKRKDLNENHQSTTTLVDESKEKVYKWDIVWSNVIVIGVLHALAVYGAYLRIFVYSYGLTVFSSAVIISKLMAIGASLGITAGYHRLWTHNCYKANAALQILLMTLATMTYQNSCYDWTRDHRVHHKFSDTDADPHNSTRGFFFSHCGWLMVRKHPDVISKGKTVDLSDLTSNPIVMFQHKYYYFLVFVLAFLLPVYIGYIIHGSIFDSFCAIACYKYVISINLTWCINSVAHIFGVRPYDSKICPTEATLMKYIGLGEGFHNYHHTFPWDYKASEFGQDARNITTYFIDFFAKIGWAYDLREASPEVVRQRAERTGGAGHETYMNEDNSYRKFRNVGHFAVILFFVVFI